MAGRVTIQDAPETLLEEVRRNVAIRSPAHLKRWLHASGRALIFFRADDLVDGLPWPSGVDALIQIVEAYRQQRAAEIAEERPCSRCQGHPQRKRACVKCKGVGVERRYKTDMLEPAELKEAIGFLLAKVHAKEPDWMPAKEAS